MGLFRFIIGTLGILIVIGVFSSFLPIFLLSGFTTGSPSIALAVPILLICAGAAMTYFGFYYHESRHQGNHELSWLAKWGTIHTLGMLLSAYIISKLSISNEIIGVIIAASILSIMTQALRNHDSPTRLKWVIFYFLLYGSIISVLNSFVLPRLGFSGFFAALSTGFTIAVAAAIIRKNNMPHHTVQWTSVILAIILVMANFDSIRPLAGEYIPSATNTTIQDNKSLCPIVNKSLLPIIKPEASITQSFAATMMTNLIDRSIWKINKDVRTCYKGKYVGQNPERVYCVDMIASRWETTTAGTIKYRWYTSITSEWAIRTYAPQYEFVGFVCEGGKKVVVEKETPEIFAVISKDGTRIGVPYP